jgi:predicted transposase YdaD
MHTDKPIYLLLGADPEFLGLLTDGLRIAGPYDFEAIDVKALERRIDGVVLPEQPEEPIWAIEVQAQRDPAIYHRLLIDMGLVGERHLGREVRGLLLFISPAQDPKTEPWHSAMVRDPQLPIRRVYLSDVLKRLERTQPDHPLLATFLPYLIDDREQLRDQAPLAYRHIQQAPLSDPARRHCLEVFQSWLLARFDDLTLKEILIMLGELTPLEQTRAYREIVEKNQPIWRHEGEAQLVLRLLQRRIGTLTDQQRARVQALPVEQLEDLGEALPDFTAPADLDAWLGEHPQPSKAE